MEDSKIPSPSEGEEYIEDFFYALGIEYEREKKITNLKLDTKQYRCADFYLPKFGVYVEFFGLWNNSGNEEYRQKKQVYKNNNIPCVFLYPENLGTIDYTFDKRIQKTLEKHNLLKELREYRFYKLKKSSELKDRFAIIALAVGFLIYMFIWRHANFDRYAALAAVVLIILYQCFQLRSLYLDIFKRNKFYLSELY